MKLLSEQIIKEEDLDLVCQWALIQQAVTTTASNGYAITAIPTARPREPATVFCWQDWLMITLSNLLAGCFQSQPADLATRTALLHYPSEEQVCAAILSLRGSWGYFVWSWISVCTGREFLIW